MIAYFESSALLKLLVEEEGSIEAAELWDASALRVTSLLTYAECRAALAARDDRLPGKLRKARAALEDHWGELVRLVVDEPTVRSGGDLAEAFAMRGYDAVHLASALEAGRGGELVFLTWDRPLAEAASRAGLVVAPPPP